MNYQVTSVNTSKSGKSYIVKTTSGDLFAKIDSGINTAVGKVIEATTEDSEYQGKTMTWVKTWAIAPNQPIATGGMGVGARIDNDIMRYMPFVSNVCANAIKGGYCQEPGHISAWAKGAYEAALALESIAEFRKDLE